MKKKAKKNWGQWATEWFQLPSDVLGEVPRIEWIGLAQLQVENHQGVEHFSPNELRIQTTQGLLYVLGQQLVIKAIYPEAVLVTGNIQELRYKK